MTSWNVIIDMEQIYYDLSHPAGFGGINRLQRFTKVRRAKVKKFLDTQDVYRTFRVPKRKFKRARIIVTSMGAQFQADLFDFQKLGRQNSGKKWILLVVDAFSRLVKCEPLRNKTGDEVAQGLDRIFAEFKKEYRLCHEPAIATDLGNEFYNRWATVVYEKYSLRHYALRPPIKCALAEISGRYVVEKLYKHMRHAKSKRWVDVLPAAVQAKNSRKNKATANMSPSEINRQNQHIVYKSLYPKRAPVVTYTLNIGDRVQVVKERLPFAKSYRGHYSDKTYRVTVRFKHTVPRYTIEDEQDGATISGTFYANELYKI